MQPTELSNVSANGRTAANDKLQRLIASTVRSQHKEANAALKPYAGMFDYSAGPTSLRATLSVFTTPQDYVPKAVSCA